MAQDFNSFSFLGRLVSDLEIVPSTADREGYGRARMASNSYKDDNTLWLSVTFPVSVIGNIHQYMTKGKPFLVTGRLDVNTYQDKDGNERTGLNVRATSVDFVPLPRSENNGGTQTGRLSSTNPGRSQKPRSGNDDVNIDELPF